MREAGRSRMRGMREARRVTRVPRRVRVRARRLWETYSRDRDDGMPVDGSSEEAYEDSKYLEYRSRRTVSATTRRKTNVKMMRRRRGSVRVGEVETVYSTVVGEGRRVLRWGVFVSIFAGVWVEALLLFNVCREELRLEARRG